MLEKVCGAVEEARRMVLFSWSGWSLSPSLAGLFHSGRRPCNSSHVPLNGGEGGGGGGVTQSPRAVHLRNLVE